jgi:hypothetical protein
MRNSTPSGSSCKWLAIANSQRYSFPNQTHACTGGDDTMLLAQSLLQCARADGCENWLAFRMSSFHVLHNGEKFLIVATTSLAEVAPFPIDRLDGAAILQKLSEARISGIRKGPSPMLSCQTK